MVTDYERAVETLWKDVRDLRADLKTIVDKLRTRTRDHVREHVDDVRDRVREVRESAQERADNIRRAASAAGVAGRRAIRQLRNKVEERPVASVLAAIGLGMLIGTLAHWRYSR